MRTTIERDSLRPRFDDLVTLQTWHAPQTKFKQLTKFDAVLAVMLFAAAIAVRWPLITRGETLLHPDEAVVGIMAQDIAAGDRFPIYFYGQRYMGALEAYVIAAISPLFADPTHALRTGPAVFFGLLVVLQYLMLTRWFGRKGGLIGAACLLAGSPMFAQWSISARGGYIENLVWGTALLWVYVEWFATTIRSEVNSKRRFLFGLLIGSGFWINPSILFFLLPIVIHSWLGRPEVFKERLASLGRGALPVMGFGAVFILNLCWSVAVEEGQVRTSFLFGLIPRPAAMTVLVLVPLAILITMRQAIVPRLQATLNANIGLIAGALIGAAPAVIYVVQHLFQSEPMEPTLPLGFRCIWQTGETLVYLWKGLPLLFGADPRPFVDHVTVGRDRSILPLDNLYDAIAIQSNRLALAAGFVVLVLVLWGQRRELGRLLATKAEHYSPPKLLILSIATTVGLFLLGGCTCSFTTIRYLLPLWAFLPGLVASVFVNREFRIAGRLAPMMLCIAWGLGQLCLHEEIGGAHPLRNVARDLEASGLTVAKAEILDAQLLSYLTEQHCKVAEFDPFWPRLAHYTKPGAQSCAVYIVNTKDWDRTSDWTDLDSPGPPPPETQRMLWPIIRRAIAIEPEILVDRHPLTASYEVFTLSRRLLEPPTGG